MVFYSDSKFQQFIHSKVKQKKTVFWAHFLLIFLLVVDFWSQVDFYGACISNLKAYFDFCSVYQQFRENTIRILYVPSLDDPHRSHVFLVVNKYGKVGLYDPEKFTLLHTYLLDLSLPVFSSSSNNAKGTAPEFEQISRKQQPLPPKCQRTHLVADAAFAPDVNSVVFATTKNLLQWYDLGDIESLSFGLEIFPRQKFLKFKAGTSPVALRNRGHVETHRVFGLSAAPIYCMDYFPSAPNKLFSTPKENVTVSGRTSSKLIVGDQEGYIFVLSIEDPLKLFGKKKTRGVLHKLQASELERAGTLRKYRAHQELVREIRFIPGRQLILSCSRDKKFSLFIKDFTETTEPYIISLPKGVNTFVHNDPLKLIATGSEDGVIRLFNQFVMKSPQMELTGHKDSVIALEFLSVPFSEKPILVSYSKDVELRAWDPVDFVCLQSVYLSFPSRSSIMTKTPEFGKKPLFIHQPNYNKQTEDPTAAQSAAPKGQARPETECRRGDERKSSAKGQDGIIIVLYCNSFCKVDIQKDTSHWPFDFEDFINEFQDLSSVYERKLKDKQRAWAESKYSSKDPNVLRLNPEELSGIESKLDSYVHEILKIKRQADKELGSAVYNPSKKSLAGEATRKFLQLSDNEKQTEFFRKAGISTAFKSSPLYDLEPIEFRGRTMRGAKGGSRGSSSSSKPLQVTKLMKEGGIEQISSVSDLLTPMARKCFVVQRLKDLEFDAGVTARTAEEMSELSESVKQEIRRDKRGRALPLDMSAKIEELNWNSSGGSEHSHKRFYRKDI